MNSLTTPKIEELRRMHRIIKRQIQSRTSDLENSNQSLRTEISGLNGVVEELRTRLRERTAELTRVNEALIEESASHSQDAEALRALATRLQTAREEERAYLAREIHDELSGSLTALKMDVSLLPDRAATDRHLFLEKLQSMSKLIDHTLDRVHAIATELRPTVLDKFGLTAAIEWQAGEFQDRSGIRCETHLPDKDLLLDSQRSTAIFRIFQEALTNVARHAHATRVVTDLRSERENLILTVRDNGKGIDEESINSHYSLGLLGMRERALAFGGTTEIAASAEGGTCVTVQMPTDGMDRFEDGGSPSGKGTTRHQPQKLPNR